MTKKILKRAGFSEIRILYPRIKEPDVFIKYVKRFSPKGIVEGIRFSDVVVFGGGNLLQDETSLRSFLYYSGIISLAKILKKPVFFLGNGIGPIIRSFSRKILKRILKWDRLYFYTREDITYRYLRSIGINVIRGVDLSVGYFRSFKDNTPREGKVIIAPKVFKEWRQIIKDIRCKGFEIVLMVSSPSDFRYTELFYVVDRVVYGLPIDEIRDSILVLSERFHPNFTAAYFGVPFVSVGSKKTERFVKTFIKSYEGIAKKDVEDVLLKFYKILGKSFKVRDKLDEAYDLMLDDFYKRVSQF